MTRPRGTRHPAELRAQVLAAVLAGTSVAQAARRFGLSKQTVSRWVITSGTPHLTDHRARPDPDQEDPSDRLARAILGLIEQHIDTINAQLQAAARPSWLAQQSAAELAELVAVERDTAIRLLAGLPRPEPTVTDELPERALEPPPASDPADG